MLTSPQPHLTEPRKQRVWYQTRILDRGGDCPSTGQVWPELRVPEVPRRGCRAEPLGCERGFGKEPGSELELSEV